MSTDIVKAQTVLVTRMPTKEEMVTLEAIENIVEEIQPNVVALEGIQVTNDTQKAIASGLISAVKPIYDKLDRVRIEVKAYFETQYKLRLAPVKDALDSAIGERKRYDDAIIAESRRRQREAEEKAAREAAELERRRKIQQAAVDAGKTARTEIPTVVEVIQVAVPTVIAENTRQHCRLKSEVFDVDLLPAGYWKKEPNLGVISAELRRIEGGFAKDRKGVDDPEQTIPGVRFYWDQVYRDK
ncbi:MAG TPA: hypothetical protein VFI02_07210 [Armatimonadota bacterium]|nr:hypothetical protein [Armatimonadota bacterium]